MKKLPSSSLLRLIISVLSALFLFGACVPSEQISPVSSQQIILTDWTYSLDGQHFASVKSSKLADLTQLLEGADSGYVWLRTTFDFSEYQSLKNTDLSLYLGRITMADITWFNGIQLGSTGRMPPNEFSSWNTARLYHIPDSIINTVGTNTITVKVWTHGEGSIPDLTFVAATPIATKAATRERFWNSQIHLLCSFVMIIMAAYHFLLWIKRKQEKENVLFAAINLISALYLCVFYLEEIPGLPTAEMDFLWFQKIISSSIPFLLPYLVTSFINVYLKEKKNTVMRAIRLAFVIIPVVIILFSPTYPALRAIRSITQLFLVPPVMYIAFILIRARIAGNEEAKQLFVGFIPLVVIVCMDLFIHNVLNIVFPYISTLGWMAVILTLLFILAGRFANARTQAEELNTTLEEKVAARTNELQSANQALEASNERSAQDMKLAVYVQQSFYPKKAPEVDGWDIAYCFKPNAGVSGDLYDFYTDGATLTGAALFDVSGHGLASALVTMLAKTIINREFDSGKKRNLVQVMNRINNSLVEDKGDIENYMTGVLLRFTGDHVEYVNAGHPPLLVRNGTSQRVQEAVLHNDVGRGSVVGINGMPTEFNTIGFTMKKGDSILLYTDCFEESRNTADAEYGIERIKKSFQTAGNGTAQDKLNMLLSDFNQFTHDAPLKDDLTIVVIQKA